ncbi:von Willebrand factor D and EGF domain-containing protein-like [Littorina saxatilis]|uniref:von Willebrand factor D and EGF domain-containing protein-like n=1 Tax=Littorina saxatilis TaxID=31220 RepID=UPI0038B4A173
MPTSCVPSSHCGTRSPYWLDLEGGKLPAVGQEKAARACAQHWWSCNWFRTPITVRNCGAFYLYKLEAPKDCDLAYCAKTV